MSEDRYLKAKVREAIVSGRFPDRAPDHVWGGPGTGVECAVCGEPTTHAEVELEVEFDRSDGAAAGSHFFHLHCFSLLEAERQQRSLLPRPPAGKADGAGEQPTA